METNEKRILIDVAEFEAEARRIAAVVGIKDDEVRFSLNDMINNVRMLVKPVNDWRFGKPETGGRFGHYLISYRLRDDRVVVHEAVYSEEFGWDGLDSQGEPELKLEQNKVIAWQPLPDPYDFKVCRHCKHLHRDFIYGEYCGLSGEEKELGQTCGNWDKKEDFCQ